MMFPDVDYFRHFADLKECSPSTVNAKNELIDLCMRKVEREREGEEEERERSNQLKSQREFE